MSLRVENLRVYYRTLKGDVHALEDATFSIEDGEIMGLAGESGCGKTTLGHSLVTLAPPMKYMDGRVLLDGQELPIRNSEQMDRFRFKDISIVPQYALNALNPTRKIGMMINDLLTARGVSYREARPQLERRLEMVRLSKEVLDRYPIELSGGMKQRVVMVISTLLNPSLLIADEVTSALDVASQKAVAQMLVQFRDQGVSKSMIVITHDVSILYQVADSIMVMYAGQVSEKAPTRTIIQAPRHPYTKALISSLPKVGVRHETEKLAGIAGTTPRLIKPPSGCRFRDRCPVAFDKCVEVPPLLEVASGHFVACWKEPGTNA